MPTFRAMVSALSAIGYGPMPVQGRWRIYGIGLSDDILEKVYNKNALRLGGTQSLPELYAKAGARLIFDADGMRELVGLVEDRLETLRGSTVS